MKVGILGTGIVGRTIGAKLAELGHDVMIGTRDVEALLSRHEVAQYGESFDDWRARNEHIPLGTRGATRPHGFSLSRSPVRLMKAREDRVAQYPPDRLEHRLPRPQRELDNRLHVRLFVRTNLDPGGHGAHTVATPGSGVRSDLDPPSERGGSIASRGDGAAIDLVAASGEGCG